VLIAGALVLLFLGGREYLGSRLGQFKAEREFDSKGKPAPSAARRQAPAPERFSAKPGETIAKLTIPRLAAEIFVVEGDNAEELRIGPGHLSDSAPPGAKGNCIIAGHRDTHFRVLKDIRKGDDILIETRSGQFLYRVKNTRIVVPTNTSALQNTKDPTLNLITCYPFYFVGSAPKRFVVEAQLAASVGT
jgi:sortase A